MLVAGKRKYGHKTLREKCQALKDLETEISNRDVADKYGVPKHSINLGQEQRKIFRFIRKKEQH